MTMGEFIQFLLKHCREQHNEGAHILTTEYGQNMAYDDIAAFIRVFLKEYAEQKSLTKKAESDFLVAIEGDVRRQFDNPVELIEHIQKISGSPAHPPEKISLSAINAFCGDFLHKENARIYHEQLQQAPF